MDATTLLTGGGLAIVLPAAVLTLPIAFFLLWLYRRAVIRLMRRKARSAAAAPTPTANGKYASPDFPGSMPPLRRSAERVNLKDLLARPWQAAAVYALGGLFFTVIIVYFLGRATDSTFGPLKFFYLTWIFLFPVCLVVTLVASSHWQAGLIVFGSYVVFLILLSAIEIAISPAFDWSQVVTLCFVYILPPLILVGTFLYPRIRAVGPMIFTLLSFGFFGMAWISLGMASLAVQGVEPFPTIEWTLYRAFGIIGEAIGLYVIGFLVMAFVGWLILKLLKWLYLHKRQSDLSLVLDPIWLIFAYYHAAMLVFHSPWLILVMFLVFGVYKIVTWAGFAWLNHSRRNVPGVKLLVLRVFSLGKRSEQLYAAVAKAWRYVGNIQFITGPDLAASTVAPHNFLDFISGKLRSRFIDSQETLERRIAEADIFPSLDGRYPILDFFCHDDTWKMVLSRLACESDVVLMDLRSFSSRNAGCKFEIGELIQLVPIQKVVFVTDKTTDQNFLQHSIQEAWTNIRSTSPNKSADRDKLNILNYEGHRSKDFNEILRALSMAAVS